MLIKRTVTLFFLASLLATLPPGFCINHGTDNAAIPRQVTAITIAAAENKLQSTASHTTPFDQTAIPFNIDTLCKYEEGTLYQSDFKTSTEGWKLVDGWALQADGKKTVLCGAGHQTVVYEPSLFWSDYTLSFDFRLKGGTHFNFRIGNEFRYFLALHEKDYEFHKQSGEEYTQLINGSVKGLQNTWHKMTIDVHSNTIKIHIDKKLLINYTDRKNPIYFGGFSFECLDGSLLSVNNIIAKGPISIQRSAWKKTGGPLGGLGYDVRIDPGDKNIMFVTDNPSGVNKSTNGGANWFQANAGITTRIGASGEDIPIFSLTIDPNDPNIVWCGMQTARGIFKSLDGGNTWIKKDNGITENDEITIRGFAVKPGDSNIIFAGTEIDQGLLGREFARQKGKIYKSTDGGDNWKCVWEGDSLARIILFDPSNPDTLYASTGIFDREALNVTGEGVLKSTDGGSSWEYVNNGLENLFIGYLAMHPTDPQTLICAAGNNQYAIGGGVYITHDGGQKWVKVLGDDKSGENTIMTVAMFSPSNPTIIYAGSAPAFFRSDDAGQTWQKFNKKAEEAYGPPGVRAGVPISIAIDPDDPLTLFVNNYGGGVFKSVDGAQTWIESSAGYTGANLKKVVVSSQNQDVVYAIGRSGPFISTDGGHIWSGLAYNPLTSIEWYEISVCPSDNRLILCADEFEGTMYRSIDSGLSWVQVMSYIKHEGNDPANRHGFKSIVFAPSKKEIVYAGMCKSRNTTDGGIFIGPSHGMFKSIDGGKTWNEINSGLESTGKNINCIAVHPQDENIVYIGTFQDGAFKSTDGGESWIAISNGLMSEDVRSLAIDPSNPQIVYAGLGNGAGLYSTTDGGQSWNPTSNGIVIECPSYLQRIGQVNPGVSLERPIRTIGLDYTSTPWTMIVSIIILPSNPNILFISDYQRGVYVSTCGGQAWNAINDGLTYKAVSSLSLSGNEAALYASTTGGGVYRLDFGDGNTNREVVEPSASAQLEAIPVPSSATSVPSNATSVLPSPPPALPNVNDVIPSVTQIPQAVMPVTLYQSDFNITADGWDLSDGCMLQSDRNELSMPGNQMAVYEPSHEWTDYLLSFGFTLKGAMRFSFRIDPKTDSCYILRLQKNEFFIRKQMNGEIAATLSDGSIEGLDNTWHKMLIEAVNNTIHIWLDDTLLADYTDVESPLITGGISIESLDNTQILLDDFLVQGPATK